MIGDRLSKRLAESDRLVDGRFLRIQFSRPEHVQPAQIQQFIAEFNKVFGKRLLDENFSIDGSRNEVLFRLTDSAARSDVKQYLDKLNYVLKTDSGETFSWTKYDFGRQVSFSAMWQDIHGFCQRNPAAVSELSSSWSQQTRVTSTLLVCAVVLAMILALFALFIVQRFRSSKRKLREMTSSTGALDSSDYKELCRQRMSEKASGGGVEPVSTRLAAAAAAAKKTAGGSPNSPTGSWSDDPITTDMDITTGHLILNYMENYLNNKEKLEQEWADLCSYEAEQRSSAVGATPENAAKNRYQDLLPYDHSRVKLNPEHSASGGDYINASYIYDSDPKTKAYILTQGPMESTAPDFWQMVHLVSEHVWFEDFIVRNFYLKNVGTGEARTVTMFHFLAWEEAGLPSSAKALLDFRRKVNKSYKGRATPLVVHCSDGCGRSGTYCLLDLALGRIAKGVKEIDLAASLEHLRDQRRDWSRLGINSSLWCPP
uniref:Receptor-type tyrosine-protein phosphatase kappa n=1 Tax=Macrostomum lignano TaxID=282301 RepID=A0A1I8I6G1_9PLAT